jgi:hypothetical protein
MYQEKDLYYFCSIYPLQLVECVYKFFSLCCLCLCLLKKYAVLAEVIYFIQYETAIWNPQAVFV